MRGNIEKFAGRNNNEKDVLSTHQDGVEKLRLLELVDVPGSAAEGEVPNGIALYRVSCFIIFPGQSVTTASTPKRMTLSRCCGVFTP